MTKSPEHLETLVQVVQRLAATVKVMGMAVENDDPDLFGFAMFELDQLVSPPRERGVRTEDLSLGTLALGMMFEGDYDQLVSARNSYDLVVPRFYEALERCGFKLDEPPQ